MKFLQLRQNRYIYNRVRTTKFFILTVKRSYVKKKEKQTSAFITRYQYIFADFSFKTMNSNKIRLKIYIHPNFSFI